MSTASLGEARRPERVEQSLIGGIKRDFSNSQQVS